TNQFDACVLVNKERRQPTASTPLGSGTNQKGLQLSGPSQGRRGTFGAAHGWVVDGELRGGGPSSGRPSSGGSRGGGPALRGILISSSAAALPAAAQIEDGGARRGQLGARVKRHEKKRGTVARGPALSSTPLSAPPRWRVVLRLGAAETCRL
ncbi:unnamed protein product, partial [Urochloa humidicola]